MLQADDIRTTHFKKGLMGYRAIDVDTFKNSVYRAYDELTKEYELTKEKLDKLTAAMEETRLKLFEYENKLKNMENASFDESETIAAKRRADQIIKDAEAAAADIIAKAKAQSERFASTAMPKNEPLHMTTPKAEEVKPTPEPVKEAPKETASSRFFKKAEENVQPASSINNDDDEIFVGEIEDARKPERMRIGDGDDGDDGFEFL